MSGNTSGLSPALASRLQRLALPGWAGLSLLIAVLFTLVVKQGLVFETDLQALLPRGDANELAQQASQRLFDYGGDKIMLVIGAPSKANALAAADTASRMLRSNPLLQLETLQSRSESAGELLDLYTRHRFHLLSDTQRHLLGAGRAAELADQAERRLYAPESLGRMVPFASDPLDLVQGFQSSLHSAAPAMELEGEHLLLRSEQQPDWSFVLLVARSRDSALMLDAQRQLVEAVDTVEKTLQVQDEQITLLRSGIVFHTEAAARQAREEITLIGGGSAIGILLLFVATFGTLRPLLLSLTSILYGTLCAFTLCHYWFGGIHLLTLVFGASLIGVAIDYSLHYFTRLHGLAGDSRAQATLRAILPGISLGLLTTVIGYASLAQAPLPGLRQIAVFSVAGLASAWLTVVAVYPLFVPPRARNYPALLLRLSSLPWRLWHALGQHRAPGVVLAAALLSVVLCVLRLHNADDVRSLYKPSPSLVQQEQQIQALAGRFSPNQFFLIGATDSESLLQIEERLQPLLEQLRREETIGQWSGISRYLPSMARQGQNHALLSETVYGDRGVAWSLMTDIGFDESSQQDLRREFRHSEQDYLLPEEWLAVAGDELQLPWLGRIGAVQASMVTLQDVQDLARLAAVAEQIEGVQFVDRVGQISGLLNAQRHTASLLLATAYACVMLLLLLRYRRFNALLLAVIPLLASLFTLTVFALAGVALSIFHVFALFLVLGLGMDYSIFVRESPAGDGDCRLAILLSALTSCLSFGLLSLSSTPMVQAFGTTVLLGSLLNLLLVPLADRLQRNSNHASA